MNSLETLSALSITRIFKKYWKLIIFVPLIGVSIGAAITRAQQDTYKTVSTFEAGRVNLFGTESVAIESVESVAYRVKKTDLLNNLLENKPTFNLKDIEAAKDLIQIKPVPRTALVEISLEASDKNFSETIIFAVSSYIVTAHDNLLKNYEQNFITYLNLLKEKNGSPAENIMTISRFASSSKTKIIGSIETKTQPFGGYGLKIIVLSLVISCLLVFGFILVKEGF